MGETVEALGYKADVPAAPARSRSMKDKVTGATGRVSDATPDSDQVKQGARQPWAWPSRTRSAWRSAPRRSASSPA